MSKTKELMIDGATFKIVKFNASFGWPLLMKLKSMIAGSFIRMGSGVDEDMSDLQGAELFADAIDNLFAKYDSDKVWEFMQKLIVNEYISVNGIKLKNIDLLADQEVDPYFGGMSLAKEVVLFNFSDSLGKYKNLMASTG